MRQIASGFAVGSFSITVLVIPFLMIGLGIVPSYGAALERLVDRSGIVEPLQAASVQVEQYRYQLMHPLTDYIGHHLFPHLPEFPHIPQ